MFLFMYYELSFSVYELLIGEQNWLENWGFTRSRSHTSPIETENNVISINCTRYPDDCFLNMCSWSHSDHKGSMIGSVTIIATIRIKEHTTLNIDATHYRAMISTLYVCEWHYTHKEPHKFANSTASQKRKSPT